MVDTKKITSYLNIKLFLTLIVGMVFLFLYYTVNPVHGDFFPECPIHYVTGYYCPGCGTQRTVHFLLHFQIGQALRYNPLVVILFPFLAYLVFVLLYNFIYDKRVRVKILYNNTFVIAFFTMILLYTIARNIPYKPFSILAPASF